MPIRTIWEHSVGTQYTYTSKPFFKLINWNTNSVVVFMRVHIGSIIVHTVLINLKTVMYTLYILHSYSALSGD